jgi:hypothetical protein
MTRQRSNQFRDFRISLNDRFEYTRRYRILMPRTQNAHCNMYIESPATETEGQFKAYVQDVLRSIFEDRAGRFELQVGRRVEWQGQIFRELSCTDGIVWGQIAMRARQPGGISRAIILQGWVRGMPHCWEVRSGIEAEFDYHKLHAA